MMLQARKLILLTLFALFSLSNGCFRSGTKSRKPTINIKEMSCSKINIVSRSNWGAAPAKSKSTLSTPVSMYYIHHSAGGEPETYQQGVTQVRSIQRYHQDERGWDDIGYNFLIGGDGSVFEGRGWDVTGAHVKGQNSVSLGICIMGNFMNHKPTDKAIQAAKNLIECGVEKGKATKYRRIRGHRDAPGASTSCPGNALYADVKTWK